MYDGSFDGLLSVVFESYVSKERPVQIVKEQKWHPTFFDTTKQIITDEIKSERVWQSIITRSGTSVSQMLYTAFASELPDIELKIFYYLEKLFADTSGNYSRNLLDEHAFDLFNIARKVRYEAHRFKGFVRFQETSDGLFFSAIDPVFNILSLLAPHFASRYADQKWVIYDTKRDKGIYFDPSGIREIVLTEKQFNQLNGRISHHIRSEDEDLYQKLWKTYYKAINIPERKNTRLMMHFLPRRYWKYLPEKH
jgi:probable DNA metabolism protein